MPRFEYKARNMSGALIKGALDASSADVLAGELLGQNMTPIEIKQVASSQKKSSNEELTGIAKINAILAGNKIPANELIIFARQMQSLTKAGLPLDRALNGLQASLKNPLFKRTLQEVLQGLESGLDLAAALGRHPKIFSPLFLSMVSVGENTGRLDMAFEQIGRYLELEKNTAKQVKSATRYPIFVVLTIIAAMVIITIFVIPARDAYIDRYLRFRCRVLALYAGRYLGDRAGGA
jgi:MSHA biogenesis protein MshG